MTFNRLYPNKYAPQGMILNSNDVFITGCIAQTGEYSEGEVAIFKDVLNKDSLAVEVGANMGAHTLALASLANSVVAFEPQRLMFQVLAGNLALNSIDNVLAVQAAVGKEKDVISVPQVDVHRANNFGGLRLGKENEYKSGEPVDVQTIDSYNFAEMDLLKIDCEGMEVDVLEGAKATLQRCRPWIFLEFESNRANILQFLDENNYMCLRMITNHINYPNFLGTENIENNYASDMLFCMHKYRPPTEQMADGFGRRHQLFKPSTEDVLGKAVSLSIWEPYAVAKV